MTGLDRMKGRARSASLSTPARSTTNWVVRTSYCQSLSGMSSRHNARSELPVCLVSTGALVAATPSDHIMQRACSALLRIMIACASCSASLAAS